jgi:tetratricopeptide (TPR) repeat protein
MTRTPHRHRSLLCLLAVLLASGQSVAAEHTRILDRRTPQWIKGTLAELDPKWRVASIGAMKDRVVLLVCRDGDPAACSNVRLEDPVRGCDHEVVGPWCLSVGPGGDGDAAEAVAPGLAAMRIDPWTVVPVGDGGQLDLPTVQEQAEGNGGWIPGVLLSGLFLLCMSGLYVVRRAGSGVLRLGLSAVFVVVSLFVALEAVLRFIPPVRSGSRDPSRFDLLAVGGSSMVGHPYFKPVTIPDLVQTVIHGRLGGRFVNLRNLADGGLSAHACWVRLERELVGRERNAPGALLIYTGHNERFASADDPGTPSLFTRLERHSFLLRAMAVRRHRGLAENPAEYELHLRGMIEAALESGVLPILATVSGNDADVEPGVPLDLDVRWARATMGPCRGLEDGGRDREAARCYRDLVADTPQIGALLRYRAARCYEKVGMPEAAELSYLEAIELDPRTRYGRATRAQNEIVRRLAVEYALPLVDVVRTLRDTTTRGLTGNETHSDGHHPNLQGHLAIARLFVEVLAPGASAVPPHLDSREACALLGCDEKHQGAHLQSVCWLLAASVRHPDPRGLLALAERHCEQVLERDPDAVAGWIGVALVQAARRSDVLLGMDSLAQVARWGVSFGGTLAIPPGELRQACALFRTSGVDQDVLDRICRFADPS